MEPSTHPWRPQLTQGELLRGLIFFGLYYFVFPFLLYVVRTILDSWWNIYLSDATANALYYCVCALLVAASFWSFLRSSFNTLLDHKKENLFALSSGLAGCVILTVLASVLPLPVENPIVYIYPEQYAASPAATVLILVVLWPVIEEVLFRGLVFGALRRHSRALAWILSMALFLFFKVWQFTLAPDGLDLRYLLVAVQYLPQALALTWCYDFGGSVWSAALLHMILNAVSLWLLV